SRGIKTRVASDAAKSGKRISIRVLHGATVGLRPSLADRFAGEQLIQRLPDIVFNARGLVAAGVVVNRAPVGEHPLAVDDVHAGGGGGVIGMADFARSVIQDRTIDDLERVGGLLVGGVGLAAGAVDRQPDHALAGVFGGQLVHVAVLVMALHDGAVLVEPF